MSDVDSLRDMYWANPDDLEVLRVWADMLVERGELRGELVHLSLLDARTPAQEKRRNHLIRHCQRDIIGPVRPHLEWFRIGRLGLVEEVHCRAEQLVANLPAFEALAPRLTVLVTSLADEAAVAELGRRSLARIYHLDLQYTAMGMTISNAGLTTLAPALRDLRHLSFDRAYGEEPFTVEGLRRLGHTVEALEYLCIRCFGRAGVDDLARVIATAPGFQRLKVVRLRNYQQLPSTAEILAALPDVVSIDTTWLSDAPPLRAFEIEALKRM